MLADKCCRGEEEEIELENGEGVILLCRMVRKASDKVPFYQGPDGSMRVSHVGE